jgi:uroporphyrinogen-III decarboxylase
MTDKQWADMTREEKRAQRFKWFQEPEDVNFVSAEAAKNYKIRTKRLTDVYHVREPDRVPVSLPVGATPTSMYDHDFYTCMYDYDKGVETWDKFNKEFKDADAMASPGMVLSGRAYDLLDYKLYKWPGHGLSKDSPGIQFVEGEYMKANEYDELINNPSDFWMRVYMPRTFGAFASWTGLPNFSSIIEGPATHFLPYGRPDVQASLKTLMEVGNEMAKYSKMVGAYSRKITEAGYPVTRLALAKAPFDTIGDTLRGTQGIVFDMYRQPDKLLEAIEVITKLTITAAVSSANANRGLATMFPLHKGADGWMSDKQFQTFYWPSLKRVINALIDEGIMVTLFAEGSFNTRLDMVNEFPKGAVHWLFDRTDMAKAKKMLGDKCCISGNVPSSLITMGTPADVKAHCRKLIEDCGKGGGYILAGGAQVDKAKPANFRAMLEAAWEYGVYKK